MKKTEIAWGAGLFEGEGCIVIRSNPSGSTTVILRMNSTDFDIPKRFQAIFGGHLYYVSKQEPHHKPQLCWQVAKPQEVVHILELLLPYFGKRRTEKAEKAISSLEERL